MKVSSSIKADPSKGDKLVRRKGRLYVINKKEKPRSSIAGSKALQEKD